MNTPERFNPQPPRPAWGIRPPTKKLASMQLPILRAPVPDEVVIPIHQAVLPHVPPRTLEALAVAAVE